MTVAVGSSPFRKAVADPATQLVSDLNAEARPPRRSRSASFPGSCTVDRGPALAGHSGPDVRWLGDGPTLLAVRRGIGPWTTVAFVGAGAAVEDVLTLSAADTVVSAQAAQRVVASEAEDAVGA